MSRFHSRYPLNVPGKYYINDQCLDCDLCRETAPNNIRRDDRTGISYVYKQPTTPEEVARVEEGVGGCPTEGVGNDGDKFDWETTPIYDWNALYAKSKEPVRFDIRSPVIPVTEPRKPWWRFW
jgi:ferredoxin